MITQDRLKELFYYQRGQLIRLVSVNSRGMAGSVAGSLQSDGYRCISVDSRIYKTHRLIWLYHYGYLPKELDHKYGKEIGDYLWNLRPCTKSQNQHNTKISKNNTSGFKGVNWESRTQLWVARIKLNGKSRFLGRFNDKEDAAKVVRVKRLELHGEFANHG